MPPHASINDWLTQATRTKDAALIENFPVIAIVELDFRLLITLSKEICVQNVNINATLYKCYG